MAVDASERLPGQPAGCSNWVERGFASVALDVGSFCREQLQVAVEFQAAEAPRPDEPRANAPFQNPGLLVIRFDAWQCPQNLQLQKIMKHSYFLLLAPTTPARTSQMHFRSKGQAAHGRHTAKPREHADRMPSTAWLAAQEAFSAPRPLPPAEPALVVVRKGRAPEPEPYGQAPTAAMSPVLMDRPARVFRVVTGAAFVADTSPALPPQELPPASAAVPTVRRRRRRVDMDKLPGPVQHIVQATPVPAQVAVAPSVRSLSPAEEIAALGAMMARLDTVFHDISVARAFRFLA